MSTNLKTGNSFFRPTAIQLAAAVLLLVAIAVPAEAAQRVALVIGNTAYKHTKPLRNPRNDATDMAEKLKDLGFRVIEGFDLNKAALEGKVREFAGAAQGAEAALLFYAGHGLQVDGENYLVPVDAKLKSRLDLSFSMIRLGTVLEHMNSAVNLVFLDARRDNPLAQGPAGKRSGVRSRGLARVRQARGTLIVYATQPDNVADDGEGRNSPFTAALLQHIATPGKSVDEVMASRA